MPSGARRMAEELRYYARSERHAQRLQAWLASAAPSYPLRASDESVVPSKVFPLLRTETLGSVVLYSEQLPSTQTLLHETLKPAPPAGVVCFTELQVQGKGRGSNTWAAPAGCLTFSFSSKFTDGSTLPFAQYLVSLAVVRAVESVRPGATAVRIKWPNDIYANGAKIGGILCQSEFKDGAFRVTTGIGINISNKEPTTCLQEVLSTAESPCNVTKWVCACAAVLVAMTHFYLCCMQGGVPGSFPERVRAHGDAVPREGLRAVHERLRAALAALGPGCGGQQQHYRRRLWRQDLCCHQGSHQHGLPACGGR